MSINLSSQVFRSHCLEWLKQNHQFHLSFIEPPFNQGKDYRYGNDVQPANITLLTWVITAIALKYQWWMVGN